MNLGLKLIFSALILSGILHGSLVIAEEVYSITIKDHQFAPAELTIPANTKIKIVVENQDATVEEFESYDLNREKVVSGNGKIILFIGPLKPGTYKYFGEFHSETAQGVIIAQ